jgi:hypothetical protein
MKQDRAERRPGLLRLLLALAGPIENDPPPEGLPDREPGALREQILLMQYQSARSDDRNFVAVMLGLASVGVAVLAGIVWLLSQCSPKGGCPGVPPFLLAGTTLAPLTVVLFLMLITCYANVRNRFLIDCERDMLELLVADGLPRERAITYMYSSLIAPLYGTGDGVRIVPILQATGGLLWALFYASSTWLVLSLEQVRKDRLLLVAFAAVHVVAGLSMIVCFYRWGWRVRPKQWERLAEERRGRMSQPEEA